MENSSSIENVISAKNKTQDPDYSNHALGTNDASLKPSNNADVSKSKGDCVNDNHVGSAHDELKTPDHDGNPLSGSKGSETPKEGDKNINTNGDINDTTDSPIILSPLSNDVMHLENEKGSDPEVESSNLNDGNANNDTRLGDSLKDQSLSATEKNKTSTSCDSEDDYLSATDINEVTEVTDESKLDDLNEESIENNEGQASFNGNDPLQNASVSVTVEKSATIDEKSRTDQATSDETDTCTTKDQFVESSNEIPENISILNPNRPKLNTEDQQKENHDSANQPEAMEVEECESPINTTNTNEQETSESNKNDEENVEQTITPEANENSEIRNNDESIGLTTTCNNSDKEPKTDKNTSHKSSENIDNTEVTSDSNTVSEKVVEKNVNIENSANNASSETSVEKNTTSEKDSKEVSVEENTDPKNTEVLHIDENEEDTNEVMDTTECDPFGQVTENNNADVEEMEVDGTSNKDCREDVEIEVVTEVDLADENSASGDSTTKCPQEKTSSMEEPSDQTDDHCIIPDTVNTEAPKTNETVKPKFDITPVRLEKLMDPTKLANSKENDLEIVRDTEPFSPPVTGIRPQRRAAKKAESQIKEIVAQTEENPFGNIEDIEQLAEPSVQVCYRCSRLRPCKYVASFASKTIYICQDGCLGRSNENKAPSLKCMSKLQTIVPQKPLSSIPDSIHFLRKCSQCGLHNIVDEKALTWEAMDFCNEECLNRYQNQHGAHCAYCKGNVLHTSMGKYSVRFGLEARQFCSGSCLEEFKKGLKSCSYCQQDITKSTSIVNAQVGEKLQSKDFCSQNCVEKYERTSNNAPLPVIQDMCTVCAQKKDVEVQVLIQSKTHSLCSDVCFMTFKFANNISDIDQCHICKKYYEDQNPDSYFVFHDDAPYNFCSKICMNVFILFRRKIVPCSWCKVKKYNFDMIKKTAPGGNCIMMCSLNCLSLYQVSMNATSTRKTKCDFCSNINYAQYHLTMSDATIRNFCSYNCVMVFQTQYNKTPANNHVDHNKSNVVPLGGPKRAVFQQKAIVAQSNEIQRPGVTQKPISTVANGLLPQLTMNSTSLKINNPLTVATATGSNLPMISSTMGRPPQPPKYIQQIIVKPPKPEETVNKSIQCLPSTATKSVSCRPTVTTKETQTDEVLKYPAVVPIPVPIYVPTPMHMFTTPFPVPVPFAVPIPVPIFIPTSKNTFKGVMQYMKEIVDKTPTNPFEADLLLMAKMVAGEEKTDATDEITKPDSGDDDDIHFPDAAADLSDDGENFADTENTVSNNFPDDVLQMALKMATEQLSNSPTVDLEAELTSNTITPQTQTEDTSITTETPEVPVETRPPRTRKRANKSSDTPARKRGRQQIAAQVENDSHSSTALSQTSSDVSSPPLTTESERPDTNMCLKFTIGIRAWKQWVLTKNDQIEQAAATANKKAKTFNTNILKLTTDELNYLLCLFVKEVRKPNGMEYAPDTVYYLCLSIQQYLFENGRIDNIFTDSFYEPFTNALDEVARKFSEINDATQYIVTRVEEEHLWESKQLGAHSPHVLLATLMFFNTKYFNLATLEEHMQLSFSHIMKHWKRNPNTPIGKPGSPAPNRNVVLRFYPPQAALDAPNSRKKKVYEQHENEVNPLRCPVKLYEFYLSKCPESVKQRNDVFYLQPERSCVPDSPVWYSTMPLQKDLLMKMLHRIRMVKEVNISLLAS